MTHYSSDGKCAYEIKCIFPDCPIQLPTRARSMTSARIDFEGVQDLIIAWYEARVEKKAANAED